MLLFAFSFACFITAIENFVLGFVAYRIKKTELTKSFLFLCLSVGVWSLGLGLEVLFENKNAALFCSRFLHAGVTFIPFAYLYFSTALADQTIQKRKIILLSFAISIVLTIINLSGNLIPSVSPKLIFKNYTNPNMLSYSVLLLHFFIFSGYGFYLLVKTIPMVEGYRRMQITYVLIASTIGFIGGSCTFFPVYNILLDSFWGMYFVPIYTFFTFYAIVRHQLLDIEVIIKKTIIFAGLFAGVYAIVAGITFLGQVTFEQITGGQRWVSLIPSIAIIVLILRPLENILVRATERFLFQKKYDYKELLKTFTTEVLTVLDKDVLVHSTVDKLSNIVKIQSCGILLLNSAKNEFDLIASLGMDRGSEKISLGPHNTLITFLEKTKAYLSTKHQGKDSPLPKNIVQDMNKLKLELAIPLVIHDDMIGILTLGKKKSDEDYTQDDMDILLPLARTLAIAISNAMVLDELGKVQAEAAQREKMAVIGTLSAGINHEICNPLGIARGQCEAFLLNIKDGLYNDKTPDELVEKAKVIMEKVIHETDRATNITKRLSSFAKPSRGDISRDVIIGDEIDIVLALVSYEMKLDKIDITKEIALDLPKIEADKKQLQQVFFNLIRNAAQAIGERGKIVIRATKSDGHIVIVIKDTGQGIAKEKLDEIFNPFYTTKDPGKGTGLGLFIVRQVVEKNGGSILVESKVNEGTEFTLTFPVRISVNEKDERSSKL
ncbi:MAG: ATP-binding protein [Candidatus Omnitrophota bacterium]